jgi:hypothetical protein
VVFFIVFFSVIAATSCSLAQTEPVVPDTTPVAELRDSVAAELTPDPPSSVTAKDKDNDGGGAISISWEKSPDDYFGGKVNAYRILRAEVTNGQPGEFSEVGNVPAGAETYRYHDGNTVDGRHYIYKIMAVNRLRDAAGNTLRDAAGNILLYESVSELTGPITSSAQWFDKQRINAFVGIIVLSFFILYFIVQARAGRQLFIRKIGGMEAVDEAVGRATEMGKKIYYVSGLGDMDNMQTIAAMTILGRVAQRAAEYDTYLDVPVCRSMVMVTAREVVKEAYSKAGRPDVYKDDQVHYLTDDQFGYAAAVDGMVVREKPATIFFMGQFFAESLILAETGNSIGAIQIAGTAMPSQLPFFVAACDYTLIGEELFAASAYLSKEPKLLGSLKGQDIGKAIILVAIIVGLVLETFDLWQFSNLFSVIE